MSGLEGFEDDRDPGDPFERLEQTLNKILAEIQKLTSKMEEQEGEEVDKEEFQSCFKIRGRPILPPVMTPGGLFGLL